MAEFANRLQFERASRIKRLIELLEGALTAVATLASREGSAWQRAVGVIQGSQRHQSVGKTDVTQLRQKLERIARSQRGARRGAGVRCSRSDQTTSGDLLKRTTTVDRPYPSAFKRTSKQLPRPGVLWTATSPPMA
jgi:hypothetical protein